jgi:hypothetical protein
LPERSEHMRLGALVCTLLTALALTVRALPAQAVRGIGDDATTPRRGTIRVQVSTSITDFTERYGKGTAARADGAREPLGIDFSLDTVGITQFPGLATAQSALRTLTGNNSFTLSLGKTSLIEQVRVQTTPIQLEAGITSRLSIGVMVPIVSARNQVVFNVNSGTASGNVSFNPAKAGDTASASVNALLVSQITAARAQLAALLTSCQSNAGSNAQCASIIANAPAINANASAFTTGITQIYGITASTGSPFVPHAASVADSAIRNRVTAFRTQFAQYGVTSIAATTLGPARPSSAITPDGFRRVLTDSASGLLAAPFGTITHQGIGDVEVAVKLRLFDTFGSHGDTARFLPRGMNLRQSFAGVYRFGTGVGDSPSNLIDIGTGSGKGQNDIEARSYTDIVYGRHFFASVIARYTIQLADEQTLRITDSPDQVFAPAWRQRVVQRDLGDQLELELTPRWVLTDFFSVGAQYLFRNKPEDKFTGAFTVAPSESGLAAPVTLNASTLSYETAATEQRIGIGLTFSTVAAHARHKAKLPIEVQYFNSRTIVGSGGRVPKLSIHQLQVRLYPKL